MTRNPSWQRVSAVLDFRRSDRVPRMFDSFDEEFMRAWRVRHGDVTPQEFSGSDMTVVAADESAWPTRAGVVEDRAGEQERAREEAHPAQQGRPREQAHPGEHARAAQQDRPALLAEHAQGPPAPQGPPAQQSPPAPHAPPGERVTRNGWGWLERRTAGTSFAEMYDHALAGRPDPDTLVFDSPLLDLRYEAAQRRFAELSRRLFVLAKTGGPYLRVAMMRGEEAFWMDIADDPGWVRAMVDRVADHITAVGVESLRRFGCQATGIAIYDDCAASWGPFISPQAYERLFLPALRRMIRAYKAAGAARVMFHSDGNVLPLLDMWVDAGIDAINPIEYRLGMDPVRLRAQYGARLACIGGVCNTEILPRGDRAEIRDHVQHLFGAAAQGGYVIGTASISSSVSVASFEYLVEQLDALDPYRAGGAPPQ